MAPNALIKKLGLLVAGLLLLGKAAHAGDGSDTAAIIALIKAETAACELVIKSNGMMSFRQEGKTFEYVSLWMFQTEGCNGGNNWGANVRAFYVKGTGANVQAKRIPIDTLVMDLLRFAWVDAVSFVSTGETSKEGASLSHVELDGTVQTDSDARCCPTGGKRVKVFIQNGRINAHVLKTWKKEG